MMKKLLVWYYGKASIRKKLVISYLLLITVPILTLGIYAFSISRKNLEEQTQATMRNNISLMASDLDTSFQRENDNIKYLSYNIRFRRALRDVDTDPVEIAQVLNEVVEPIFWYFITSDHNMKGIEIYSPYVSREIGSFLKPDGSCREEGWYQYHMGQYGTLWTYESGELFATRTLLDDLTASQPIGVLKMSVYPSSILESIHKTDYLNNGILIVDGKGQVVYEKKTGKDSIDSQVRYAAKAVFTDADQGGYLLLSRDIPSNGWKIYYYVDKEMISGQLREILRSTLVVVGACMAVILVLISILSKALSRRILRLKEGAEQIAEGDFDIEIPEDGTDEIGVVAKSLRTMCGRINEMITRVYKAELEKKVMELKALQAMINPHFLYNCLSSIKWKAIKAGNDDISDLTGLLAKFYRTSLNGGRQITTVASEMENVKAYIELQRKTHDNQFTVQYDLDDAVMEKDMPNFLLQPIVENAIEHGIRCQEEEETEGLLIVRALEEGNFLVFEVQNNGPQIDMERLEEILNTPGKGYGIFNIRERIRIYYGEGCGVSAGITPEGYTCFTIRIRKEMQEEL